MTIEPILIFYILTFLRTCSLSWSKAVYMEGTKIDVDGLDSNQPISIGYSSLPKSVIDSGLIMDGAFEFDLKYIEGSNTHNNVETHAFIAQINKGYVLLSSLIGYGDEIDFYDHKALKALETMNALVASVNDGQIEKFRKLLTSMQKILKTNYEV